MRFLIGDDFFDWVVFCSGFCHCVDSAEKRKKSIEEVYRVLKFGGEAIISSWGVNSPRLKNKEKECFVPWTSRDEKKKVNRYTYVYDLDELVGLCESVGLRLLRVGKIGMLMLC